MWAGVDYTAAVLSFYFSSSYFTKIGTEKKRQIEDQFKKGGQRNIFQVLSNGGTGLLITLLILFYPNMTPSLEYALRYCYICHYCVCNGDTWASELGSVYGGIPRLITTMTRVPPGTNGGVTMLGLAASFAGGSFVGLIVYALTYLNGAMQIFGSAAEACIIAGVFGFLGSLIDSIMGATMQLSLYSEKLGKIVKSYGVDSSVKCIAGRNILTNGQVNLSSLIKQNG